MIKTWKYPNVCDSVNGRRWLPVWVGDYLCEEVITTVSRWLHVWVWTSHLPANRPRIQMGISITYPRLKGEKRWVDAWQLGRKPSVMPRVDRRRGSELFAYLIGSSSGRFILSFIQHYFLIAYLERKQNSTHYHSAGDNPAAVRRYQTTEYDVAVVAGRQWLVLPVLVCLRKSINLFPYYTLENIKARVKWVLRSGAK